MGMPPSSGPRREIVVGLDGSEMSITTIPPSQKPK